MKKIEHCFFVFPKKKKCHTTGGKARPFAFADWVCKPYICREVAGGSRRNDKHNTCPKHELLKLSWNEIKARAARFAKDWRNKGYEKGQTQVFYYQFFQLFGMNVVRFASFEEPVRKLGNKRGFIDLFWKGTLLVEQKSIGRDLKTAREQALDYFPGLRDEELPRYLLLSDFQHFELFDLEESTESPKISFPLAELPDYVEHFAFVRGDVVDFIEKQEKVNIQASEMMAGLHDLLKKDGFVGRDLQVLLIRLVFCLFADDTGIFEDDIFLKLVQNRSSDGGRDLGRLITELFDVLNTPEKERQKSLDREFARFPCVNGSLFAETIRTSAFDAEMRSLLIKACEFDWREVSPAIFGSLFQAVMDGNERREQGAHYTSEENILKVIGPLFLEDLHAEFEKIQRQKTKRREKLRQFHKKISKLCFLDPACGCGNFLVVTYQKLQGLETLVLKELYDPDQQHLDVSVLSLLNVDKFYGVEIGEFPAKIAQVALWMTDHLCNIELGSTFGQAYSRIPLVTAPNIHCADALEIDWEKKVLNPKKCSYLLGNPPFVGNVWQSGVQRKQIRDLVKQAGLTKTNLDFVCAWFIKAGEYIQKNKAIKIGFVATNSIVQGEQVSQLWSVLFERYKLEIAFAHRTFVWTNEARGKAAVHCVIIGLSHQSNAMETKRLFSYDDPKGKPRETRHTALTAYLFDGENLKNPHLLVNEAKKNQCGLPKMIRGVQPTEGGNYIFTEEEKSGFLQIEPQAEKFFRPFIGSAEFINNKCRHVLILQDASPHELNQLPEIKKRIEAVRKMRLASRDGQVRENLALRPTTLRETRFPTAPFLAIPETSSENRDYIPIGYLMPPTVPSNAIRLIEHAEPWHFAILTSRMHMAWMRQFGGRLKSDYRYSIGLCYNPFPWPAGLREDTKAQEKLSVLAQNVLDARTAFPDSSLADLYNPTTMPANLRNAHNKLDKYVDSLYRKAGFADDRQRVEHLFALYEEMVNRGRLPIP